jgi:hypothetical protein
VKSVEAKKGYKAPINLWIIIIAESGDKKTPVMNRLMKPIHKIQNKKVVEHQKAVQYWKQKQQQAKAVNPKQTTQDPEPKLVSVYTTDTTIEALAMMLDSNHKGIMLFQDEIAAFLLSFDKYRGGKGGDREQYLNFWNGNAIKVDRASKETIYISDPFLSLLGGLQPRKAVRLFGEESFDDGLISRFLFYRNQEGCIDLTDYQWRADYEKLWTSMIDKFYSVSGSFELKLSDAAWSVFKNYDNELSRKSSYLPSMFKIFIPKATNYVLRIAGILHFVECYFNPVIFSETISPETIRRAINLVNYFLSQSRKIMELYAPKKKLQLNMDARAVLSAVVALSDTRNSFELPTNEMYKIYNNQVPEQARLSSDVSFGKLLGKIFKEQKLPLTRKKLAIDGKTPQGIITDAATINKIRELLKA